MQRTAIYVLSSVLLALLGLIILLSTGRSAVGVSIATSLIAAGLSSLAFVIIRYFDDLETSSTRLSTSAQLEELASTVKANGDALHALNRSLLVARPRGEHRVFDRNPEEEIREEIQNASGHLEVDVMGLTLRAFCRDQLDVLMRRGDVSLRLLTQDPSHEFFSEICRQESRDVSTMTRDIILVTRIALSLQSGLQLPKEAGKIADIDLAQGFGIQTRWFRGYPTATLIRVNSVIFARPRFLEEASKPRIFFERYLVEEGTPYESFKSYFETAWDNARLPDEAVCQSMLGALRMG